MVRLPAWVPGAHGAGKCAPGPGSGAGCGTGTGSGVGVQHRCTLARMYGLVKWGPQDDQPQSAQRVQRWGERGTGGGLGRVTLTSVSSMGQGLALSPVKRDLCTTPSFRRKPESRPRMDIGASLQIPAFHPHPNPLPSRERGLIKGLVKGDRGSAGTTG